MRKDAAIDAHEEMVELNTTPLIDVLLVLLVMLIITIPPQTHNVKLDLPRPATPVQRPNPIVNELEITKAGATLWNGQPVTDAELREELRLTGQMDPEPELHLRPDGEARYEVVDRVLATVKSEHVDKVGIVGNERFLSFSS
ncbi:MAG TPA: biopolymer transporter ExbD [Sphingomicrobium sp.]|jgi:biopolymer transport protein ExbD|nr:biopolymer transporter ExbD [Sphingomicrobium sp.]